jgi:F0F1-type ATP synthase assembly protein I
MFLPIIGLTIAGVTLDLHFHTKPWLTTAGILIGVVIAGILIARQLRKDQR